MIIWPINDKTDSTCRSKLTCCIKVEWKPNRWLWQVPIYLFPSVFFFFNPFFCRFAIRQQTLLWHIKVLEVSELTAGKTGKIKPQIKFGELINRKFVIFVYRFALWIYDQLSDGDILRRNAVISISKDVYRNFDAQRFTQPWKLPGLFSSGMRQSVFRPISILSSVSKAFNKFTALAVVTGETEPRSDGGVTRAWGIGTHYFKQKCLVFDPRAHLFSEEKDQRLGMRLLAFSVR